MKNNEYIFNGKGYALGGLINGDIDNITITSLGGGDVYHVEFDSGHQVALSDTYGLAVVSSTKIKSSSSSVQSVKNLSVGDVVLVGGLLKGKITKITKREGLNINVPKQVFNLNGVMVSRA